MQSAAQGSTPFANNWQWGIGNPTVAAIAPTIAAGLTTWLGPGYMNAEHPILGPFFAALGAFIITWIVVFLFRMLKAGPHLYYQEKDRADSEKTRADALIRQSDFAFVENGKIRSCRESPLTSLPYKPFDRLTACL
jgi:hypothetical protein